MNFKNSSKSFLPLDLLNLSSGLRNGQAPVFLREPPGHVYFVNNNSSITVHCMVNAQPSPRIQWYQKKLNNVIPVFRQQSSTLSFKSKFYLICLFWILFFVDFFR